MQEHLWRDVNLISSARKTKDNKFVTKETIGGYQVIHAILPVGSFLPSTQIDLTMAGIALAIGICAGVLIKSFKKHGPFGCKKCGTWFEDAGGYKDHWRRKHESKAVVKHPALDLCRKATSREDFMAVMDRMISEGKIEEALSGNYRNEFRKAAARWKIYVPPGHHQLASKSWKFFPEMFWLFGFDLPNSTAEEYGVLSSGLWVKQYRALLRKHHPDTADPGIPAEVSKFWLEIVETVAKVCKYRLGRFENGSVARTEHKIYLTRLPQAMLLENEVVRNEPQNLIGEAKKP